MVIAPRRARAESFSLAPGSQRSELGFHSLGFDRRLRCDQPRIETPQGSEAGLAARFILGEEQVQEIFVIIADRELAEKLLQSAREAVLKQR